MSLSKAASSSHGARPTFMIQPASCTAASKLVSLRPADFIPSIRANSQWLLISRIFARAASWGTTGFEQSAGDRRCARLSRTAGASGHPGVSENPDLSESGRVDFRRRRRPGERKGVRTVPAPRRPVSDADPAVASGLGGEYRLDHAGTTWRVL